MPKKAPKRKAARASLSHRYGTRGQVQATQEVLSIQQQVGALEPTTSGPDTTEQIHLKEVLAAVQNLQQTVNSLQAKVADVQGGDKGRTSAIPMAIPIPHVEEEESGAHQVPSTFNELCEGTMGLDIPETIANLGGVPLAKSVPLNIKKKIWANEYLELVLVFAKDSNKVRAVEPDPQDIRSIEDWTNSFHIFMAVYTAAHPTEGPALLKYISNVRRLAKQGGDWASYDRKFREIRADHSTRVPWDYFHAELWILNSTSASHPFRSNPQSRGKQINSGKVPFGFCFKYHGGGVCKPWCARKHFCPHCQGKHRASTCDKQNQPALAQQSAFDKPNSRTPYTGKSNQTAGHS